MAYQGLTPFPVWVDVSAADELVLSHDTERRVTIAAGGVVLRMPFGAAEALWPELKKQAGMAAWDLCTAPRDAEAG